MNSTTILLCALIISCPNLHADRISCVDYMLSEISDPVTRANLAQAIESIPQWPNDLAIRIGCKFPQNTRALDGKVAWSEAESIKAKIEAVHLSTSGISNPDNRAIAEKELAAFIGIARSPDFRMEESLNRILELHERAVSYQAVTFHGSMVWNLFWKPLGNNTAEAKQAAERLSIVDVTWISDIICDQLREYARAMPFGPAGVASIATTTPDLARTLCVAVRTKFRAPAGGWNAERLRRFAIKQLKHTAKRSNLAPAEAEAIATALHQLEAFQPEPMNRLNL